MTTTEMTTDLTPVAQAMLDGLETAWNSADGAAFAAGYAPDASFVTIRGERIVGRAAIGAGHQGIFTTIYAGSVNRLELIGATEVAEGVILVFYRATLDCPSGPLAGRHHAVSTNVMKRADDVPGRWEIAATQNTLVTS